MHNKSYRSYFSLCDSKIPLWYCYECFRFDNLFHNSANTFITKKILFNQCIFQLYIYLGEMSSYHKVFVYGTLKGNEPNHHQLMDKKNGRATFVGTAKTVQRFPLVIASRYNIPYLMAVEGTGENVQGEIYEVDDVMLGTLDFLEAHPKYYERKIKKVTLEDSNKTIDAWVYLLHKYKPHMLDLPFLKSYESEGSHNMKYVARYQRPITGSAYWIDVKHV